MPSSKIRVTVRAPLEKVKDLFRLDASEFDFCMADSHANAIKLIFDGAPDILVFRPASDETAQNLDTAILRKIQPKLLIVVVADSAFDAYAEGSEAGVFLCKESSAKDGESLLRAVQKAANRIRKARSEKPINPWRP